ncbi:hypothetical protein L2E82_14732 [Cichorium intybus]|uniref:Uncharacterized protein n=1 Tax=Cichorium intybus TaxID=13427 RepID=A0ACB9F0U4_CICIN|nr:hypothetical protein L2E82_14732 [Cichorium intybus]
MSEDEWEAVGDNSECPFGKGSSSLKSKEFQRFPGFIQRQSVDGKALIEALNAATTLDIKKICLEEMMRNLLDPFKCGSISIDLLLVGN